MITRENYLQSAIELLSIGLFKRNGLTIPTVKVSTGLPGGRGGKKAIGQHWAPHASIDNVGSIFISPVIDETYLILSVLVHELVHASVGNEFKHGPVFTKAAKSVGLTGKMTATVASNELLDVLRDEVVSKIGVYPHAKLNISLSPIKKQASRMIKMECISCGYIARTSQTNLNDHGPVLCPCNNEPMEVK